MGSRLFKVFSLLLLISAVAIMVYACSEDNSEDDGGTEWKVEEIVVDSDSLYTFHRGDVIGEVAILDWNGPIGARVRGVCRIDELSVFADRKVNVKIYVVNPDATRVNFEPVEWVQEENEKVFYYIVPPVETIPSFVNFRVLIYEGDPLPPDADDDDDDNDDDNDDNDDNDNDDNDDDDNDNDNDDTTTDDDLDDTPNYPFQAWANLIFKVDDGTPALGD